MSTGSPIRKNKKVMSKLVEEVSTQLGNGPMRFGPIHHNGSTLSIQTDVNDLSDEENQRFTKIKVAWETNCKEKAALKGYSNEEILRIATFCGFDRRGTLNFMKRMDQRYFHLSAKELAGQLRTKTLFPCPGLKTNTGSNVFYMRPSRFDPRETPTSLIIDNLVFVMDYMSKKDPLNGISFIANMEGWTMANFCTDYCRRFMQVLQGHDYPAKVDLFLILNPPAWFGKIWAIMKPMLAPKFRKRVHMIRNEDLFSHMDIDFEYYLPDEVKGGEVDTGNLVRDFVLFQQAVEDPTPLQSSKKSTSSTTFLFDGKLKNDIVMQGYISRKNKIEAACARSHSNVWHKQRGHNSSVASSFESSLDDRSQHTVTTNSESFSK